MPGKSKLFTVWVRIQYSRVGGSHLVWIWLELGLHIDDEHAENGPACIPSTQYPVLDVQRAHGDEGGAQVFVVLSRVLPVRLVPLRKTVKRYARELFVLSGLKDSFKAGWGLQCEVINVSMATGRGRYIKLNDHGLLSVHSAPALMVSCRH